MPDYLSTGTSRRSDELWRQAYMSGDVARGE